MQNKGNIFADILTIILPVTVAQHSPNAAIKHYSFITTSTALTYGANHHVGNLLHIFMLAIITGNILSEEPNIRPFRCTHHYFLCMQNAKQNHLQSAFNLRLKNIVMVGLFYGN